MGKGARYVVAGWLLLFAVAADAEWLEASSDHFVIYSQQDEASIRKFADRLERFHAAMAFLMVHQRPKPSPSNRVTVFVVDDAAQVREITRAQNEFIAGQYLPRAGACVAVIPKLRKAGKLDLSGETVLYHEYAHHFMIGSMTDRAYPRWFTEGFAEFFAGAKFNEDGTVLIGMAANHRANELAYAKEVPLETLLEFDGGASPGQHEYDAFYGQSWLLYHYLQMAPERHGQLIEYQRLLNAGQPALQAAEKAFGDLSQLGKDMKNYLHQRGLTGFGVPPSAITVPLITVRKLGIGESAIMPFMRQTRVGVDEKLAQELVPKVRAIATLYPSDPVVMAELAEAEFDAGNDDAAIAAADAALALDARNINAYLQKGYALERKAEHGLLPKTAWKDVIAQFVKANQLENDHPIPLVEFYVAQVKQGLQPTQNAVDGLEWALQLAPFDQNLRSLVVNQMITDERYELAAQTLAPLAYSPHPGEATENARRLLEELETKVQRQKESPQGER
jgi:tetratricopeptide (TPR) repeat protein